MTYARKVDPRISSHEDGVNPYPEGVIRAVGRSQRAAGCRRCASEKTTGSSYAT